MAERLLCIVVAQAHPKKIGENVIVSTDPRGNVLVTPQVLTVLAGATFQDYKKFHQYIGTWKDEWDAVVYQFPFFYKAG